MLRLWLGIVSFFSFCAPAHALSGFKPLAEVPPEIAEYGRWSHASGFEQPRDLEFPEPRFDQVGQEVKVSLPGARSLTVETLPALPFIERVFEAASDVVWDSVESWITTTPVPLAVLPETLFWSKDPQFQLRAPGVGRYFPGRFTEVVRRGRGVLVRFFPLQWDRKTGEVVWFRRARVRVIASDSSTAAAVGGREGLILVKQSMLPAARLLQDFQVKHYGVGSDIVTMEVIRNREALLPESEYPDGYKNISTAHDAVVPFDPQTGRGYDYVLARKTAAVVRSYLGARLKYVTLIGDGGAIPPSYYFSVRMGFGAKFGPTDLCYVAENQCQQPKASIGRLPLESLDEMRTYLAKVQHWLEYSAVSESELALFGGKAFFGPFYIGELSVLRLLGQDADWRGVRKNFRTKRSFDKANVLDLVAGKQDSSIVYYADHGEGNGWAVEGEHVTSKEIAQLKAPGTRVQPLVFSMSCSNAAYDLSTTKEDLFKFPAYGDETIGASLLRSAAGAVAYVGSSRPVIGAPLYEVDSRGNLAINDSSYTLKILDSALENYRKVGRGRLGDFLQLSLGDYAAGPAARQAVERFRWAYFTFSLIGDPAMSLPSRTKREEVFALPEAVAELEPGYIGFFPRHFLSGTAGKVRFRTAKPVSATFFVQSVTGLEVEETELASDRYPLGESEIEFEDKTGFKTYFLRLENVEGTPVERQIWFRSQLGAPAP